MLKRCLCTFALVPLLATGVLADSWSPPKGYQQVPLWPARSEVLAKGVQTFSEATKFVTNVRIPTYTVFSPPGKRGKTALIVFPGGGHKVLAMDLEGTEVCRWFAQRGVTCVLVKYRVPYSGCYYDPKTHKNITPNVPMALQDAQRAISTIRHDAEKYGIHPNRIGVMGFSAGGNVTVLSSTRFKKRSYQPTDDIDKVSCRPDFAIPVYPGHMVMTHKNKTPWEVASQQLNTDIPLSKEIPPTLLVHAKDDPVDPFYYSEVYARELKKIGAPVRLNGYPTGGHAFGVRPQGKASDRWMEDVLTWMTGLGLHR